MKLVILCSRSTVERRREEDTTRKYRHARMREVVGRWVLGPRYRAFLTNFCALVVIGCLIPSLDCAIHVRLQVWLLKEPLVYACTPEEDQA